MKKLVWRNFSMNKLIPKYQTGTPKKGIVKFGLYGKHPNEANRTPQWDSEENKVFNTKSDQEYLNNKGIKYTKEGQYYIDDKGKYLPGIIYYKTGKDWNHYSLGQKGIEGFDNYNLSQEQYDTYRNLGLDFSKFFPKDYDYNDFIPDSTLTIPSSETKVGNSTITFKAEYPWEISGGKPTSEGIKPNAITKNALRRYTKYGTYHVVDPDNNYDFYISFDNYRDGGSQGVCFYGDNIPEQYKQQEGLIRYNGILPNETKSQQAAKRLQNLNNLLKTYGITLYNNGGKLIPKQ